MKETDKVCQAPERVLRFLSGIPDPAHPKQRNGECGWDCAGCTEGRAVASAPACNLPCTPAGPGRYLVVSPASLLAPLCSHPPSNHTERRTEAGPVQDGHDANQVRRKAILQCGRTQDDFRVLAYRGPDVFKVCLFHPS